MDFFKGHKLEYGKNGYTLILYVNPDNTEFAEELGSIKTEGNEKLQDLIKQYVNDNFKDIKINTVKLVLGSLILGTITLGIYSPIARAATTSTAQVQEQTSYTVQAGDTLWKISQRFGISISKIKEINKLTSDTIYVGQKLKVADTHDTDQSIVERTNYIYHTVVAGDSLWTISRKYGVSIDSIKQLNGLTSVTIFPGQKLKVKEQKVTGTVYIVKAGDTLWRIARDNNTTIDQIRVANTLNTDVLMIGQKLFIPKANVTEQKPIYSWPDVTYIVQPGDTATSIAKKFNVSAESILRYNYMAPDEWFDAGDMIAISGHAPRTYVVTPGEASAPARVGKLVDWVTEGQYIIKRGNVFTIVDVDTGRQFKVRMLGGYNHADVETVTTADTNTMRELFGSWQWAPRAVVIYKDGMNIAASLSGMPHSIDTIDNNGVTGHFDLYLLNSKPHSETASPVYLEQHRDMVTKARG